MRLPPRRMGDEGLGPALDSTPSRPCRDRCLRRDRGHRYRPLSTTRLGSWRAVQESSARTSEPRVGEPFPELMQAETTIGHAGGIRTPVPETLSEKPKFSGLDAGARQASLSPGWGTQLGMRPGGGPISTRFAFRTSSTPSAVDFAQPASALRIARIYWDIVRRGSRRSTRDQYFCG
jgi:hypothetical protein